MLTQRQELNTQLQQIIDAFLLAISLWLAHTLRAYSTEWFALSNTIDPFRNYHWLLIVIMPFGPIFLELQGFYQSPLNKGKWKSFGQIVRAMIGLSIMVSAGVIFFRQPLANRSVPLLFILIGTLVLLIKERIIVSRIRGKPCGVSCASRCSGRHSRRYCCAGEFVSAGAEIVDRCRCQDRHRQAAVVGSGGSDASARRVARHLCRRP